MSSPLKAIGNLFSGGGGSSPAMPIIVNTPSTATPPPPAQNVPTSNPSTNKPGTNTSFLSAIAPAASTANQGSKTLLGQ